METQKFRKKPVVIEAVQFEDPLVHSYGRTIARWCGGEFNVDDKTISIPTLEGVMTARAWDWIIRGVNGEFYPCKPDIFSATYESTN